MTTMDSIEQQLKRMAPPPVTQDARELLAKLYREIGVSAVAAALDLAEPKAEVPVAEQAATPLQKTIAA
jgi:hypothetical protein